MDERSGFIGTENLKNKITKSIPYNQCANYFIVMAVYMFISNFLLSIMSSRTSLNKNFSINISVYLFAFCLLVLVIMYIFKNKAKKNGEILTFKLIEACGILIVLNVIVIAVLNYNNSNYSVLPLFGSYPMVVSAATCIFMCGSFLNNIKIKSTAFIYFVVTLLIISGVFFVYYRNSINYSIKINVMNLAFVAYVIFPAAGYLLPGIILKLTKKHNVNEMEDR